MPNALKHPLSFFADGALDNSIQTDGAVVVSLR